MKTTSKMTKVPPVNKRYVLFQRQEVSKNSYKLDGVIQAFEVLQCLDSDNLVDLIISSIEKHQGQNWYECFTCGLTSNEGACVVCAVTCHRDHEIFYRGNSSFFCDCQFKFDCFALPDKYKERSQGRSGYVNYTIS